MGTHRDSRYKPCVPWPLPGDLSYAGEEVKRVPAYAYGAANLRIFQLEDEDYFIFLFLHYPFHLPSQVSGACPY